MPAVYSAAMANMIDKVAWVHVVDRRVLMTRSRGKDTYYLPGGKREPGESDEACLRREVREELSVELRPETLRKLGVWEAQAHGKPEGVKIVMPCYEAGYAGELRASAEIEEFVWLTHADRERTGPVGQLVFDWLHARGALR
jgi:8-oxo-dGTP pyrophosphatase MutT (NUDIX family)